MSTIDPGKTAALIIWAAVRYLRHQGETVECGPFGTWVVNGIRQTTEEVIAYANDLREVVKLPPLGALAAPRQKAQSTTLKQWRDK